MKALIYVEQRDGKVRTATLEAAGAAAALGCDELHAVFVGDGLAAGALAGAGVSKLFLVPPSDSYSPEYHAAAVAELARDGDYDVVFFAATQRGKEIAPLAAVGRGAAFLGDVLELAADGGGVKAKRSLYGGKLFGWFSAPAPLVVTTRPKMFAPASGEGEPAVEERPAPAAPEKRAVLLESHASAGGKVDLTEADIIVSGGRGMKDPANFAILEELADLLGGVVGASRAAVDAGWRPHSDQVGQTGKVVSPQVYFAVGISGAIQHLAGMSSSKVIVAVNKDPEAPIFKVADYGVVGDAMKVVPALSAEIRKKKEG